MDQEMGFLDKVYTAYERAFVLAVVASHLADRWHDDRLSRSVPSLAAHELAHARRWWGAGTWAFYILCVVAYVLAYNWP